MVTVVPDILKYLAPGQGNPFLPGVCTFQTSVDLPPCLVLFFQGWLKPSPENQPLVCWVLPMPVLSAVGPGSAGPGSASRTWPRGPLPPRLTPGLGLCVGYPRDRRFLECLPLTNDHRQVWKWVLEAWGACTEMHEVNLGLGEASRPTGFRRKEQVEMLAAGDSWQMEG